MFKQLYGKNKIDKLEEIINKIESEYLQDVKVNVDSLLNKNKEE
tara:strand:- start:47 stop:178 length:132 start_codon:yes stop_codon:yes gene_type:complete